MGKKERQEQRLLNQLQSNLRPEVTGKDTWDLFYNKANCNFVPESHVECHQVHDIITKHLSPLPPPASILVPACGSSKLSENLYDAGFTNITNVDFSKAIISHMLRQNVRQRPLMKWRVADMTKMGQFANETFDAIVDKGGLDGLIDPKSGTGSVTKYVFEVKRLLKTGGKYICVTFGDTHTCVLLYFKFRFGWKMSLHAIPLESSFNRTQAFLVVAEKLDYIAVTQITLSVVGKYTPDGHGHEKAIPFLGALKQETDLRESYANRIDELFIPHEDLVLVAKQNFSELEPGRRLQVTIGDFGASKLFYECILIDAPSDFGPFSHHFFVYLIPRTSTLEWLLQNSEGQWVVAKTYKAARLLMVGLDTRHSDCEKNVVLSDITPLIKPLTPSCGREVQVIFASDGIKKREVLHQVKSASSGLILVEDVIYEENRFPAYASRRLNIQTFLISEALYMIEKNKGKQGFPHSSPPESHGEGSSSAAIEFDHSYLASPHHNAIITGLILIYEHLDTSMEALMKTLLVGDMAVSEVKTVIIGLRAGVLSMFLNNCIPYLKIEVIENDPLLLDVSREYFGFREDGRLKVHICDGVEFVREKAKSVSGGKGSSRIDVLIVDVEVAYSRTSHGFTAPTASLIDESFLLDVKESLSENGLFICNFITWSSSAKASIYSRLKAVFNNVFHLPLAQDINEVIFAWNTESPVNDDDLTEACNELARCLRKKGGEWCQRVIDASKLITPLK